MRQKIQFFVCYLSFCFLFSCGQGPSGVEREGGQVSLFISGFKNLSLVNKIQIEYLMIEENKCLSAPGTRDPREYKKTVFLENKKAEIRFNKIEPANYNHIISIYFGERKIAQTRKINLSIFKNSQITLDINIWDFRPEFKGKATDTNKDGVSDLEQLLNGEALCEANKSYCIENRRYDCKDGFELNIIGGDSCASE